MNNKEIRALARERGLRPARPGKAELLRPFELQEEIALCNPPAIRNRCGTGIIPY